MSKFATDRIKIVREIPREEFIEKCTGYFTDLDGTRYSYQRGRLHSFDAPALEYKDGTQYWYRDGLLHRAGGPAVTCTDGERWYFEGQLHRVRGPAITHKNGTKFWYHNGQLRRAPMILLPYIHVD